MTLDNLGPLKAASIDSIDKANSLAELDEVRIRFLSRKGEIASLFDQIRTRPAEERPSLGKELNELRNAVQKRFDERKLQLESRSAGTGAALDLSLPGRERWVGSEHPIMQTLAQIKRIFQNMGFSVATGPEIEDDYHNFEALNFPPDHPARDMQDTFFIADNIMLRTHTTPVQIRIM